MANIYKKVNTDLITTAEKDVYTVPGNTRALLKSIHIYNEGAGDSDVTVSIGNFADGTDYIYDNSPTLAAGATEEFVQNILVLEENDTLKFLTDLTGPDVTVSLLEMNRVDK